MNNDLDLIIKQYPEDIPALHVYAIGDVHVGSPQFDEKAIKKKIKIIQEDPCAAVCICGDLGDYGLKNAKTNVYQATMQPRQQQEYIYELFLPIADKIAACVPGNHEERITREVGTCPMYDLCVRWGIPEVYRENMAITKYSFGVLPGHKDRSITFISVTTHGSTRNKHRRFTSLISGADFFVSGHTHQPEYAPRSRLIIDSISETAKIEQFFEIIVDANLTPGGYGLKKEYEMPAVPELQYVELSAYRDGRGATRKLHKVMNYHAIQI